MESMAPTLQEFEVCTADLKCIRNVCILAHVDHGKTTVADLLLSTNRIVSQRMAGFLRYLDDRPDEQERGITMKSSVVSLLNIVHDDVDEKNYKVLMNLVDTPGHIDFSSEVSAAIRVSDGALILVDLVEGVCAQTRESIVKAYEEHTKMILVLNKLDRLVVELKKDVEEVYQCILRVIEGCNAIIAELYRYEFLDQDVNIEDTGLLFSPETGNVIFASSLDGWGFTTKQIAKLFINIVNKETVDSLNEKIWNPDCYIDSKREIRLGAVDKKKPNLFKQFCLKTVMHIYETLVLRMERDKIKTIAEKLGIKNLTRDMTNNDPKRQTRALLQAWKPLSATIFLQCLKVINPPNQLSNKKIKHLLNVDKYCEDSYLNSCIVSVMPHFETVSIDPSIPTIAYVSKMFCVDKTHLSQNKPKAFIVKPREQILKERAEARALAEQKTNTKADTEDEGSANIENNYADDVAIIGFARVFTGSLKRGQEIYVMTSKYLPDEKRIAENPEELVKNNGHVHRVVIRELYMMFGRELVLVDRVTAGNFCGISGIEEIVSRTATLSTVLDMVPLSEHASMKPVVRHAVEPVNPRELPILRNGLRLLMQSDSGVEVVMQESGELVLVTAGDVHLGKCIEDLKTKFAKIEINVSSPMVSLRETICPKIDFDQTKDSVILETEFVALSVIAFPLSKEIVNILKNNQDLLWMVEDHKYKSLIDIAKQAFGDENRQENVLPINKTFKSEGIRRVLSHVRGQLSAAFDSSGGIFKGMADKIWSVGRTSDCGNLLINNTSGFVRNIFQEMNGFDKRSLFDNIIVKAFNTLCNTGPICEEPLTNCMFVINDFKLVKNITPEVVTLQYTSVLESAICGTFRKAFEEHEQRLMEPLYVTDVQVNTTILGKVYSVINRRHGKVIEDVCMDDREKNFLVRAYIPVIDSDGFANEIRKTTSGQANPTLRFSHYEIINGDPFNETVEEENDDEEEEDKHLDLRASKLRNLTRKRKGLHVDEEVVVHAEKQRTLNKKK